MFSENVLPESHPHLMRRRGSSMSMIKAVQTINSTRFRTEKLEEFYDKHEEIGKGHFASVFRVTERSTNTEYAAKFIKKKRLESSKRGMSKKDIQNEINILAEMDHENIIYLHQVYESREYVILVLELVGGGELFDFISEREWLTEEEASCFVKKILLGVQHLHSKNVVHLDLKPENVILKCKGSHELKLIDFGVSKKLTPGESVREMLGTTEFVSPEVINYEPISLESDMWSVGVITYIMLSGASPFLGDTQQETYANVVACDYHFDKEFFPETSELAKDFIRKLLVKDPSKRSSVDESLAHPWIRPKSVNDEAITRQSSINMGSFKMSHARGCWKHSLKVVVLCNDISRLRQRESRSDKVDSGIELNSFRKTFDGVESNGESNTPNVKFDIKEISPNANTMLSLDDKNFVTSAINCAIVDDNIEGLDRLLSLAEININQQNDIGESIIHQSVKKGRLNILKILKSQGGDIESSDINGDTALHIASRHGHINIVVYLITQGIDINLQNRNGETSLHIACNAGHNSTVEYLISTNANVDSQDINLDTPLHIAARRGFLHIILLLWRSKANFIVKNKDGDIALNIASRNGDLECKNLIMECML